MNRMISVVLLVFVLLAGARSFAAGEQTQVESRNKELAKRVFSEIYGAGKVDLVDQLYAEDFVDDSPGGGKGRDLIKEAVAGFHSAMPDLHIEFEDVLATGDKVIVRYVGTGTQTGPYGEIAATGKRVRVRGITIFQIVNGKIKTEWTEYDRLGLLRQLGVIP